MRKLLVIAIILALTVGFFPNTVSFAGTPTVLPLFAGQNTQVGMVTLTDDGSYLTVKYQITVTGWFITESHLYVGAVTPEKSAPGLFPYEHTDLHTTSDSYSIPITDGVQYYVAAHAVVIDESSGEIVNWDCPTPEELNVLLPSSGNAIVQRTTYPNAYFDVTISNGGVLDGTHPAWCIDQTHGIPQNTTLPAGFYSSYAPLPAYLTTGVDPNIDKPENMDLVNWLINHHDEFVGYTMLTVQYAIWHLIDANPESTMNQWQQALYDAAVANGEGFIPDPAAGDVMTVVVAPVVYASEPPIIGQTLLVELKCTPVYRYQVETAWAKGSLLWKTGWGSYLTYIP